METLELTAPEPRRAARVFGATAMLCLLGFGTLCLWLESKTELTVGQVGHVFACQVKAMAGHPCSLKVELDEICRAIDEYESRTFASAAEDSRWLTERVTGALRTRRTIFVSLLTTRAKISFPLFASSASSKPSTTETSRTAPHSSAEPRAMA